MSRDISIRAHARGTTGRIMLHPKRHCGAICSAFFICQILIKCINVILSRVKNVNIDIRTNVLYN